MSLKLVASSVGERLAFIGCDEKDQQNAAHIWSLIEDEIEGVVWDFYNRTILHPVAPSIDKERLPDLTRAQKNHWRQMLLHSDDNSYFDNVRRVGATHYRLQVMPRWYIAGYTIIANRLIQILAEKLADDTALLADLVCTMNRRVAIDLDLALTVYTATAFDDFGAEHW